MARPNIDPSQKCIKQSLTIKADVLPILIKYCQKEERSISFVVDKALREYLRSKGEEI